MAFTRKQAEWFYLQQQKKRRKSGSSPVQRYFTELVAAGGMRYQLTSPLSFAGDFVLRADAEIINSSDGFIFSGGTGATGFEVYRDGGALSRTIAIFYAGVKLGNSSVLTAGQLYTLTIRRVGTTVTVETGGSTILSVTISGTCMIDTVGARSGGSHFFTGVLANLSAENNATPVLNSPVDEAAGVSTIANLANPDNPLTRVNQPASAVELYVKDDNKWIGDELWVYGDAVAQGSEIIYSNIIGVTSGVVSNGSYAVNLNYSVQTGELQLLVGNSGPRFPVGEGVVSVTRIVESTSTGLYIRPLGVPAVGIVSNISVKRILEIAQ